MRERADQRHRALAQLGGASDEELVGFVQRAYGLAVDPRFLPVFRASLRAIWESLDRGLEEALDHGYGFVTAHWDHPDSVEGAKAFVERRRPDFSRFR